MQGKKNEGTYSELKGFNKEYPIGSMYGISTYIYHPPKV